jgi:excinuclease UvrABC nuclease subunit
MRQTDCVEDLPSEPGLYRHINKKTKKVDYIGQTNNIRRRNQEHRNQGLLNDVIIAWAAAKDDSSRDDLCNTEKKHIKKHRPTRNKYKGGNGRR